MTTHQATETAELLPSSRGWQSVVTDVSSAQRACKGVPWGNPMGAAQFGSTFFMITGFHGFHVSCGVIYLLVIANKVRQGHYDVTGNYQPVEIAGLYWHFVDLVWVFIFAFFYLW